MRDVGISNNFALYSVTVLSHSCANYRNERQYWAEISSLEWHAYCLNRAYSHETRYHYETNFKSNSCVIFTEYHMIQFILHCLINKTEGHSAQTAACAVIFGIEQCQSTNCL